MSTRSSKPRPVLINQEEKSSVSYTDITPNWYTQRDWPYNCPARLRREPRRTGRRCFAPRSVSRSFKSFRRPLFLQKKWYTQRDWPRNCSARLRREPRRTGGDASLPGAFHAPSNPFGVPFFYKKMVHPKGFEPLTFWSVARRSIQLSYGCTQFNLPLNVIQNIHPISGISRRVRIKNK